jgi:hypothetical protein
VENVILAEKDGFPPYWMSERGKRSNVGRAYGTRYVFALFPTTAVVG